MKKCMQHDNFESIHSNRTFYLRCEFLYASYIIENVNASLTASLEQMILLRMQTKKRGQHFHVDHFTLDLFHSAVPLYVQ